MAYSRLEAEVDATINKFAAKLQAADRLGEQFLSKTRRVEIGLDDTLATRLRDIKNVVSDISRQRATIKIKTEADNSGTRSAQAQVVRLEQSLSATATKIAVVHRNLQDLGKGGITGVRLDTRDIEAGLSRVRAGVLRYQKEFSAKTGTPEIIAQVNKLEKFFAGQGIKADAFNRVVPELKRVLELQEQIKGNRDVSFEIHVNEKGVADIKNIGVVIDGLERQLNEIALKRQQLADTIRSSGTVASVIGGQRNINVDLLKRPNLTPNTIDGNGAPSRLITRATLNDLSRYDDLIAGARKETAKFDEELSKSEGIAGRVAAAFERVAGSVGSRLARAAEKSKASYGSLAQNFEGATDWAKRLVNTIARLTIGYAIISQISGLVRAGKEAVVDFNEEMDRARIAFTTFLGSETAANKFLGTLRQFAKVTPYNFKDLVPLTQQLVALGVVSKNEIQGKAIPALRAIGDASAALGKGDEGISRIVLALGQMTQKGKASAEEVTRQLAEVGVNGAKYIAQAMGVTIPKVFELMKKGAIDGKKAANAILQGIASDPMFAGMMDKQAKTFEGAMNNIKDALTDVLSTGFRPLYDEVGRTAQELANWANSDEAEKMAQRLADRVKSAVIQFKALYQILSELRGPVEGLAVGVGALLAAEKLNGLLKVIGALRDFRALMAAGTAAESAGIALPALAPALAPLLAFATNPFVLAILAGTVLIGGLVLWKKWQNTVAETARTTKELEDVAKRTSDSLDGLTSVAAVSDKAAKSIAFVRKSVEEAGKDPKKLGAALDTVARAEYKIKKLNLDPLALKLIEDELERVKHEIEDKAITLNIKIVTTKVDGTAEAKKAADAEAAMYDAAFERAKAKLRTQFMAPKAGLSGGGKIDVYKANAAAGTEGLESEDVLNVLARKQVIALAAHNRALAAQATKIKATVDTIAGAITKYRQADDKSRPGELKNLIKVRDEWNEKTKKGIALSAQEAHSLQDLVGIIARAQGGGITHFGPTANAETAANKARLAALKLEKDRLGDAASLYDAMANNGEKAYQAMAKAAEDSGKRQVDALRGVKDSLRDLFGGMQDYFAKMGLLSTPLDTQFSKIQSLVNLGPRLKDIAVATQSKIDSARTDGAAQVGALRLKAVHARMSLDKLNGGDGQEPAGQYKAQSAGGTIPAWLKAMSEKTGDTIGKQCGETLTAFFRRTGIKGSATSIARSGNATPLADGTYAPGTVFNFKGGRPGYRVNHYATVAPDGRHWLESNWHGKGQRANMITDSRPINWARDIAAATWGGRVNAGAPNGGARVAFNTSKVALAAGKAGGVLNQAVVDSQAGADLIKEIFEELNNLKLTKFTALPRAFGAAVKENEKSTFRFQAQMFLVGETGVRLRKILGDKAFAQFAHQLRDLTNNADSFKNSLDAVATQKKLTDELIAKRRNRGVEEDPLGQYRRSLRPGHENNILTKTMQGTVASDKYIEQLKGELSDSLEDTFKSLRAGIRDRRSISKAGSSFIGARSVDSYGLARAEELQSKKVDFRNSTQMQNWYHAGKVDGDTDALRKYNAALEAFSKLQAAAYDEGKRPWPRRNDWSSASGN